MKRCLSLLLLLVLLLTSCATNVGDAPSTTPESSTPSTTALPEEPEEIAAITEFTIIIPKKEVDNSYYNSAVLTFRSALYRATNVRVDFRTDQLSDNEIDREVTYEILIGATNREESKNASEGLKRGDYRIRTVGTKIVIGFGDEASLSGALNKLTEFFVKEETVMVPADFDYTHRFEGTVVACMGDSITFSLNASSKTKTYPAVLQSLLGETYLVGNYGRNGATTISDFEWVANAPAPYIKSPEYKQGKEASPDIVLLMLGMNDGNPTHRFNVGNSGVMPDTYLTRYREDLVALINSIRAFDSHPTVYLAITTPMARKVGAQWSQDYVTNFTNNLVKLRQIQREVATELGVTLIETEAVLNDPSHFSDGCHLSDKGYAALAEHFASVLTK